jgi:predicted RNA-binding Zn ribbon-like protein
MPAASSGEALAGCVAAPRDDLCLAFVNTCYWRGSPSATDDLRGTGDLLAFATAGGVEPALGDALARHWEAHPLAADLAFAAAVEVRETLHRVFAAIAEGAMAAAADLAAFNGALAAAAERTRMTPRDGSYVWEVTFPGRTAVGLLSPVLWSAADLLTGTRRDRVRQCDNPQCRWVFLDDSKSGNRRWCSMASCGNRAKAHRHYLKRREAGR